MARQDINTATFTGTLVREPDDIAGGKGAKFSVANNESWYDKEAGEAQEYANFFDVVVWGGQSKPVLNYLTKGSRVAVTGRLKQERWEKDGKTQSRVVLHAAPGGVLFLDKKGDAPSKTVEPFQDEGEQEEIPF